MSSQKPHFRTSKGISGNRDQKQPQTSLGCRDRKRLPMPKWTRKLFKKLRPKKKTHTVPGVCKSPTLKNDPPVQTREVHEPPFECSCSDILSNCTDRSSLLVLDEIVDSSLEESWAPMTFLDGTALLFIKSQAAQHKLELSPWNLSAESSAVDEILKCKDPYTLKHTSPREGPWDQPWDSAKLGMSRWINYSVPCAGLFIPCSSLQTLTHFDARDHYVLTMRTHFRSLTKGFENFLKMETVFCCSRVSDRQMRFRVYWHGILHPRAPWTVRGIPFFS